MSVIPGWIHNHMYQPSELLVIVQWVAWLSEQTHNKELSAPEMPNQWEQRLVDSRLDNSVLSNYSILADHLLHAAYTDSPYNFV